MELQIALNTVQMDLSKIATSTVFHLTQYVLMVVLSVTLTINAGFVEKVTSTRMANVSNVVIIVSNV
jgi:hypothetical protein